MNCMKKIIPLFAAICLFAACEKGPDMGKLDSNYLVYTNFDKSAKFDSFETFYLPDSLLIIGENKSAVYASDNESLGILNAFASNMAAKGYVRVDNREEADLGLQVSYVESTYYLTDYTYPQWWWGYPGYWGAPYWGNWYDWYYPYPVTYSYSTGSFLGELLNLDAPEGASAKLPVLWTCYMSGFLTDSNTVNTKLAIYAVNQAFAQSPYLKGK